MTIKKLFVALLITTALTAQASSRDRSTEEPANEDHWKNDAPFPKLQYGQKLCMSNIPPGDPFYNECRACEKKGGSACGGDLRDRMRRSPYGDPDALVVTSIAFNNENAAVIISKSSREKAVKEALEACRAGGKFICEDKVDFVLVHSWRPGKKNAPLDANRNACFFREV